MDETAMLKRLASAPVARLATVAPDGRPHLVPICFALDGRRLYFAVDAKPKRTRDLKRLRNIAVNPAVSVLADHYEDDWSKLWWVRADGTARVIDRASETEHALALLQNRYPQYRRAIPEGPVVEVSIEGLSAWSGS